MDLAPVHNGVSGNIAISSLHPLFAGVDSLFQDNGNSITDLDLGDPRNQILVDSSAGGLYAIWDDRAAAVPEPGTMLLMGMGLGALGARRRSRSRR